PPLQHLAQDHDGPLLHALRAEHPGPPLQPGRRRGRHRPRLPPHPLPHRRRAHRHERARHRARRGGLARGGERARGGARPHGRLLPLRQPLRRPAPHAPAELRRGRRRARRIPRLPRRRGLRLRHARRARPRGPRRRPRGGRLRPRRRRARRAPRRGRAREGGRLRAARGAAEGAAAPGDPRPLPRRDRPDPPLAPGRRPARARPRAARRPRRLRRPPPPVARGYLWRVTVGAARASPPRVFPVRMSLLLLIAAGAAGGFLVGLVGVGGGVVYVPVLLVYFAGLGVRDPVLAPLVVGSSLLCVGLASASGAYGQWRAGAVRGRVAVVTGLVAGVALTAVSLLVTTRPWYDRTVFQAVFGAILLGVAAQMLRRSRTDEGGAAEAARPGAGALALAGASAGALAAVAGVGGGVVLVPLYHGLLGFPTKVATATSTAAIALIAAVGVVAY